SGFAHLFEHMMFEGSAHVKKGEQFQLISRAGGSENGSTAEDRTNYYETVPSNRLNLALWLEADRMRSLTITDENFHNQRETVKEERRLRVDNQPYSPAFIDGMTWPFDSAGCFAYAHTVIGSMADLNAAQLSDVRLFRHLLRPQQRHARRGGRLQAPRAAALRESVLQRDPAPHRATRRALQLASFTGRGAARGDRRARQPAGG